MIKAADLFCGAGGTSTGLIEACKELGCTVELTAINHWDIAIATHLANHPEVKHLCTGLENVNPRTLFKEDELELMWASPECMHHSIARGGKPINDQSRSTAWHVVQWAEALRPKAIIIENVKEFLTWGPIGTNGRPLKKQKGDVFRTWVKCLESIGYKVDWRILRAADFGDPTTRERLFIQAVRGRRQISWPTPSHTAIQKNDSQSELFGKRKKLKAWVPARDIIDWTKAGKSIFERKKPLSEKTLRRIWAGLEKFGFKPFIVPGQSEREGQKPRTHDIDEPVPTVTATGHAHLVEPYIVRYNGESNAQDINNPLSTITTEPKHYLAQPFLTRHNGTSGAESIEKPLSGQTTKQKHGLAQPYLVKLRGKNIGSDLGKPVPTITAGGTHHGLAEPFLIQVNHEGGNRVRSIDQTFPTVCGNRGEHALIEPHLLPQQSAGRLRPVSEPVPTIAADGAIGLVEPYLVKFYGNSDAASLGKPLDSLTTKQRFGLVRPVVIIDGEQYLLDIHFRMLQPNELSAAQGFPRHYKFTGTKTDIVKQIGNAVPMNLAKALCKSVLSKPPKKKAA